MTRVLVFPGALALLEGEAFHTQAKCRARMLGQWLALGIDCGAVDSEGRTVMHFAAAAGDLACVRTLVDYGGQLRSQVRPIHSPPTSRVQLWLRRWCTLASVLFSDDVRMCFDCCVSRVLCVLVRHWRGRVFRITCAPHPAGLGCCDRDGWLECFGCSECVWRGTLGANWFFVFVARVPSQGPLHSPMRRLASCVLSAAPRRSNSMLSG